MGWPAGRRTLTQAGERLTRLRRQTLSRKQLEGEREEKGEEREVMVRQDQQTARFLAQQMGRHENMSK